MGIKIKNLQTGEFEKFNIPALKGEKGEPGEVEPSEKVDYIGKQHSKLRDTMNANVDYIIKTAIGEFNYLDYEGQHITATNSIEGHAKSAILSGNTLVNLFNKSQDSYTIEPTKNIGFKSDLYKTSTTYLIKFDAVSSNTNNKLMLQYYLNGQWLVNYELNIKLGINKFVITSISNQFNTIKLYYSPSYGSETVELKDIMLIEYQEDMENWDIPYFEGMQSVKMPVLTTTGKNLFDYKNYGGQDINIVEIENGLRVSTWACSLPFINNLLPNTQYTSKSVVKVVEEQVGATDIGAGKIYIYNGTTCFLLFNPGGGEYTFTTPSDIKSYNRILFYAHGGGGSKVGVVDITNMQIEEGSTATSYEPFKSNILTVNEPIELGSVGNVHDILDSSTGKVIKRTETYTYKGEIEPYLNSSIGGYVAYVVANANVTLSTGIISDKFINRSFTNNDTGVYGNNNGAFYFFDKLVTSVQEFKEKYIGTTFRFELKEESIKTVDLSDNHVYSYKDTTHYACSSEDGSLVPTLSVKVPTDTQLTIQEQKATTQTLLIKNMDLQQSIKEVQAMNLAFNTALYNSFNSIREEVEDIKKHVSTNENLEGSF